MRFLVCSTLLLAITVRAEDVVPFSIDLQGFDKTTARLLVLRCSSTITDASLRCSGTHFMLSRNDDGDCIAVYSTRARDYLFQKTAPNRWDETRAGDSDTALWIAELRYDPREKTWTYSEGSVRTIGPQAGKGPLQPRWELVERTRSNRDQASSFGCKSVRFAWGPSTAIPVSK